MEVNASAKFIRLSPRKVRLVLGLIRGLSVKNALAQLQFLDKAAARPVEKLLRSAIANASHNYQLDVNGLRVKKATADGGPTLHRWAPRAMGRAVPIRKRTSHITIVLDSEAVKKTS